MSRSYRKTESGGFTTARSERRDKKAWHSAMRAANRQALAHDAEVMPEERDVSNPWSMAKDGKTYRRGGKDAERRGVADRRRRGRAELAERDDDARRSMGSDTGEEATLAEYLESTERPGD